MEEEKDLYPGEISIEEFSEKVKAKFNQVLKHWKVILIVSIVFGLAGWFYAKQLPEYYVANILFILSSSDKQQSQDNLIAQQLGLGQKGGNGEGLYTVQNFLGLLVHSKMIRETLLLPYPMENTHTFASKYMALAGENKKGIFTTKKPYNPNDKEQISLLRSLAEQIRPALLVKPAEDGTSFTQFSGRFENEEFAKYFTESLLNYTLSFYVEGKTKEIKNNIRQIEERKDSLLRLLTIKSRRIANQQVQSIDLNPAYSSAMVEGQIMSNEGEFLSKLYAESVASLEVVRSELRQQTPLFTIIEGAEYPLVLEIPARMKWFWAMLVLGFLIGGIYFILKSEN
jgi:capsule polysaccharide export protein KpsE/RkpR